MDLLLRIFFIVVSVAVASSSAAICDQIDQTAPGDVGERKELLCSICTHLDKVEWYRVLSNDTVIGPLSIENPEESSNLVVPIEDSSTGGRVYYCRCSNQPIIECHKILVEPYVTITASPEVASKGSTINITCLGEGYPQPQSSDFALNFHLPNLTVVPLPDEWKHHIENGIQVIIPRGVFPDHSGTYKCSVAVNVTEFDPDLPIRNPILHGNDKTDVYVYASRGVKNFTTYETLPEEEEESSAIATVECIIEKPEELSVNWTRRGEVIPKNPGFKYIMTETVMEDSSLWVYQLTVRRLTQGDIGEYGCTISFMGDVKGVVPVSILESDLSRDTGSGEPHRNCSDPTTPEGGRTSDHRLWFIIGLVSDAVFFSVVGALVMWYFIKLRSNGDDHVRKAPTELTEVRVSIAEVGNTGPGNGSRYVPPPLNGDSCGETASIVQNTMAEVHDQLPPLTSFMNPQPRCTRTPVTSPKSERVAIDQPLARGRFRAPIPPPLVLPDSINSRRADLPSPVGGSSRTGVDQADRSSRRLSWKRKSWKGGKDEDLSEREPLTPA